MVKCVSWGCFSYLKLRGFVFTVGKRKILSLKGPVCCAGHGSPPVAALWLLLAWVKVSPQSALQAIACLPLAGSSVISKRPAVECKGVRPACHNHGPFCWDLGVFPAQGEGQIMFFIIRKVSFGAFAFLLTYACLPHLWMLIGWRCLFDISEILTVRC